MKFKANPSVSEESSPVVAEAISVTFNIEIGFIIQLGPVIANLTADNVVPSFFNYIEHFLQFGMLRQLKVIINPDKVLDEGFIFNIT